MTFFEPVWLLLALPLLTVFLLWKAPSRYVLALRVIMLTLLVFALAGAALRLPGRDGMIIVVADRSRSMPPGADKMMEEMIDIIHKSKDDGRRVGVVSFAESSVVEQIPETVRFSGFKAEFDGGQSRLNEALENALAFIPDDTPARILLLSDGVWTGLDPAAAFARCASRGVAVDYRLIKRPGVMDLAVADVDAPLQVFAGEFFPVTVNIQSPGKKDARYEVLCNGRRILEGDISLAQGANRFFFRDRSASSQVLCYTFKITDSSGSADPVPENNQAEFIVKVRGARPVLLITMSRESGMGAALKLADVDVDVKLPHELSFSLAELSAYSGVIIENVPAGKIGQGGMSTFAQLVRNTGTGLLLTGGKNSYGVGGYYNSPLEPVLPVSMELKREHRKLSMGIVVALDRSGSMNAPAGGGRTKMDLANLATAEVLKMLSPNDRFGVIAVDTEAHEIVPVTSAANAMTMMNKILHIHSMGGGIYVYNALHTAVRMLAGADVGTRHIILFADAADAEQPGQYKELLEKATAAGITVSVIGLGYSTDSDALFLQDVALRGNGRCFFSNRPEELPRLFAQDTFVIARNTFIDSPVDVELTGAMHSIAGGLGPSSFQLGGYNLCYLRPEAVCAALTQDEYKAPVVAFWHADLGRVICYTGEVDGAYTGAFAQWQEAGNLLVSMVAWSAGLKGENLPGNMLITQDIENGVHNIRLHLDPERAHDPFQSLPELRTLSGTPGNTPQESSELMRWESPDTLVARIPLNGSETSLSTVIIEKIPPQVLSPVMLPYSPEFKPVIDKDGNMSVSELVRMTGGVERLDLTGMWRQMPVVMKTSPVARWLLLAAILVLLLEVFERRTGMLFRKPLSVFRGLSREPGAVTPAVMVGKAVVSGRKNSSKKAAKSVSAPAPEKPSEPDTPAGGLFAAMDKVKKDSGK